MPKIRGFTFIELLIAVSIFAVAAVALYSAFFAGVSVWKRSASGESIHQGAKFAFGEMAGDLKNAVHLSKDEESIFVFSGSNTTMAFMTIRPVFLKDDMGQEIMDRELVKVEYSLDENGASLIRAEADISLGFDVEKAGKEVLLDGLQTFTLEYCYDSGDEDEPYLWEENWEDEEMRIPRGVRVTSVTGDGGAGKNTKFTKTIFVPAGVLGEKEVGL